VSYPHTGCRSAPLRGDLSDATFVRNHLKTFDHCNNPNLLRQHGAMSQVIAHDRALLPAFSSTKFARNGDFLLPSLDASDAQALSSRVSWRQKKKNKLFWRGAPIGACYNQRGLDWRQSHRMRLHLLAHKTDQDGSAQITIQQGTRNQWTPVTYGLGQLNDAYTDISAVAGDYCVSASAQEFS
jgi:hypothetical protein